MVRVFARGGYELREKRGAAVRRYAPVGRHACRRTDAEARCAREVTVGPVRGRILLLLGAVALGLPAPALASIALVLALLARGRRPG